MDARRASSRPSERRAPLVPRSIISTGGTPNGHIEMDITLLPKLCLSARPALEHHRELGLSIHEYSLDNLLPGRILGLGDRLLQPRDLIQ